MSKTEDDIRKIGVLYEAMQDDIKKLLELFGAELIHVRKIPKLAEQIENLQEEVGTLKLIATETNKDLKVVRQNLNAVTHDLKVTKQDLKAVRQDLNAVTKDVKVVTQDLKVTKQDVRVVKIRTEKLEALVDQQQDHEIRLTQLEHA